MAKETAIKINKAISDGLISYYSNLQSYQAVKMSAMRSRLEKYDRAYQRSKDKTEEHQAAKKANAYGDTDRLQNVTVPVVMPQVESSVEYLSEVFLGEDSLFSTVASPKYADAALQMATIIQENARHGGWARELLLFFRDGRKYEICGLEVDWCRETQPEIYTAVDKPGGTDVKEVVWSGNKIKRLDMYNTFWDSRVQPSEVHKYGEFAGYTELYPRMRLKQLIADLGEDVIPGAIVPAFNSTSATAIMASGELMNYYVPQLAEDMNASDITSTGTNWSSWYTGTSANKNKAIDYKDSYEVTKVYCRILPEEFGLSVPKPKTPQIFKLYIVNHRHIICCKRLTNAHGWLPILLGQPSEDGLGLQTKSLIANTEGFQDTASALMNSVIQSRRRAISDRTLYDPSRILAAHINSPNPSAKIPVKPAAYGSKIADSVYAFPYREDQGSFSIATIHQLIDMANILVGQNRTSQGQFIKGNKNDTEFNTIMNNSTGRDRMASIMLEHQVFMPMKHMIKLNILQHQGTGVLYNEANEVDVAIDPVKLREAVVEFRITDGVTPANKIIKGETFSVALQQIGSSPSLASGYNVPKLFSYLMKSQGAKISDFEKSPQQMAYEQALASWERMVTLLVEKSQDGQPQLPPQPKPADYGFAVEQEGKTPSLIETVAAGNNNEGEPDGQTNT